MMGNPAKILVIKPSSLGDVVHVFPALELLRRSFPGGVLDFVIHPAFAGILDLSPFPVRKKIIFDRKKFNSPAAFFPELFRLLKEIRAERYDLAVDFQGLFRSAFFSRCARSAVNVGFAEPRERGAAILYSRKVKVRMEQHAVERYAELVNRICGTDRPVPELKIPETPLEEKVERLLPERFMVLVPGARWETKVFPAPLFSAVVKVVRRDFPGMGAVIAGTSADAPAAAGIRREVPDAVDLTGKTTLVELAEVMRRSAAVLTNDSGPMHIGALAGAGVFALFGPTSPRLTGPYGGKHRVFRRSDLACTGCMKRKCPSVPPLSCHRLEPEEIGRAISSFIAGKC